MANCAPKGRGAITNASGRFEQWQREAFDDGWSEQEQLPLRTVLTADSSRSVISYNESPDVSLDRSINPYRGCEHGCVYCFARPSHAWLGHSPGLDFESRIHYKPDAPQVLRRELAAKGYDCAPLMLGVNTDAYQPSERRLRITRQLIEVLAEHRHPFVLITKSSLVERDIDLLAPLAQERLVSVAVSITTAERSLSRQMEPRAAAPQRRFETLQRLSEAGIPTGIFVAPVVPALTDHELESLLEQGREAGALFARYILMRVPREVEGLVTQWLQEHHPDRAEHVLSRLRDCHGGKAYDSKFGTRMTGTGPYAELIRQRFHKACKRLGFAEAPPLDVSQFISGHPSRQQMDLF